MGLLLLLSTATAAPLSPIGLSDEGRGVEFALDVTSESTWLAVPACSGNACAARRDEFRQGLQVDGRLFPWLGGYVRVDHLHEATGATGYEGDGWGLGGGLKGNIPIHPLLGIDLGAGFLWRTTTGGEAARASRSTLEATAGVHYGSASDGIVGWLAVDAVPFAADQTALDGIDATLWLHPGLPGSVRGGFLLSSAALDGRGLGATRVAFGVEAAVGFRTSLGAWLSLGV